MGSSRIAVQVEGAVFAQYPAHLHEAHRHHGEVGHNITLAQKAPYRRQNRGKGGSRRAPCTKRLISRLSPTPRVYKGGNMSLSRLTLRSSDPKIAEERAIEGGVEK